MPNSWQIVGCIPFLQFFWTFIVLLVPLSTLFHLSDSCDATLFNDQSLILFLHNTMWVMCHHPMCCALNELNYIMHLKIIITHPWLVELSPHFCNCLHNGGDAMSNDMIYLHNLAYMAYNITCVIKKSPLIVTLQTSQTFQHAP